MTSEVNDPRFLEVFGELLRRAREGDSEALGKILDSCRRVLHRWVQRTLPDKLRARCPDSDLVQETFMKASREFDSFRGESPEALLSWTISILHHNFDDLLRYWNSRQRDIGREIALDDRQRVGHLAKGLADARPGPAIELLRREITATVNRSLSELSPRARAALSLRYEEHLEHREIGARLGCSAEAARKLCARALQEMRRLLGRQDRL
jgi:RNA polymerase sigma-70 factor (subfamily 1)